MASFEHINLKIDRANPNEGITKIIREIRPQWKEENTVVEPLTGGWMNKTFKIVNNNDLDDGLVLRINGDVGEQMGISRRNEIKFLRLLSEKGVGLPLLAAFENGIITKLVAGKSLNDDQSGLISDSDFAGKVAKIIAKVHHIVPVDDTKLDGDFIKRCTERSLEMLKTIEDDENIAKVKELISWDDAHKETDFLFSEAERLKIPVSLSHNDLWDANILYDKESDAINLIDYECMEPNLEPYDVACYLLCATTSDIFPNKAPVVNVDPDFTNKFIRKYLTHKAQLEGKDAHITDDAVENYHKWIKICSLMFLASWPTVLYVMHCHSKQGVEIDYAGIAILWYKGYMKLKKEYGY